MRDHQVSPGSGLSKRDLRIPGESFRKPPRLAFRVRAERWCDHQCDPAKGDVAFSQPTQSGKRVMDTWGQGRVLVFNEDEQDDDSADEGEVE